MAKIKPTKLTATRLRKFLTAIETTIPPIHGTHHNITLVSDENNKLQLTLSLRMVGLATWQKVILEDKDFERPANEVAADIFKAVQNSL